MNRSHVVSKVMGPIAWALRRGIGVKRKKEGPAWVFCWCR